MGPWMPPIELTMRWIKSLGFDGTEVLFTKYALRRRELIARTARRAGLDVAFHRWWPPVGDGWHNKLVTPHLFPKADEAVWNYLPQTFEHDVVLCSYEERSEQEYDFLERALFQPTPTGIYTPPFNELKAWIKERQVRLVLDIGHWLEYHFGGAGNVPMDLRTRLAVLVEAARELAPYIHELHLYGVQHYGETGMNKFPDTLCPLFLDEMQYIKLPMLKRVTWEISPFEMIKPYAQQRLRALPTFTRSRIISQALSYAHDGGV